MFIESAKHSIILSLLSELSLKYPINNSLASRMSPFICIDLKRSFIFKKPIFLDSWRYLNSSFSYPLSSFISYSLKELS